MNSMADAYAKAGIDVRAGYEVVERIKKHVRKAERLGMVGAIGRFGGCFGLSVFQLREPVLVSGTGSVGAKLAVAIEAGKHDTVRIDCVAMCINDILAQGAEPLYFLDYLTTGKNDLLRLENIAKGVASGCVQGNMALIGGETTEMSSIRSGSDYDLAGFAVGIAEKPQLLTGETVSPGGVLLKIASSRTHSNGYSLVREIFLEQQQFSLSSKLPELRKTLGGRLLEPVKICVSSLLPLIEEKKTKGAAHITGGGFVESIPRMLPESVVTQIKLDLWPVLPIFGCLQRYDEIPEVEMYEIFNIDIGMVLAVGESKIKETVHEIEQAGKEAYGIGKVIAKKKHHVMFIEEER